ncbi:MAG: class I SAM-dependent methyltransferase [Desulfovibrionaceae bacterium]
MTTTTLTAGTGSSAVVTRCQVCDSPDLVPFLFIGYIPPVNQMHPQGDPLHEQPAYPAQVLFCPTCGLVQLGCIVDPAVLFPPDYPYTSGTTRILHRNFEDMVVDCTTNVLPVGPDDLVVDIGSNDGTLLSKWRQAGHRVHGIEPTDKAKLANERGIPSTQAFFTAESAAKVRAEQGPAKVLTATNVFAHIENIHGIVEAVLALLDEDGVFISESHYLMDLLETCQYDTVYHEHLRYYSLTSLAYLLNQHGLEVVHVKRIPSHGGSIRVYAARHGKLPVSGAVAAMLAEEQAKGVRELAPLQEFARRVVMSKLDLYALLRDIKARGERVYGVGAPSRASTLITYTGLDAGVLDCVLEIKGSHKIGRSMPGTVIPVIEEAALFEDQPEYALLLSWHIADELMPKLREKGFKGRFILPLPSPRIVG